MQFNSWIFLVVFLPLLLFLYFILNKYLNKRWATYSLTLGNLVFYQGNQNCITDLSHYMDSIHFDSTVANDIVDYMKSSDNKLTRDNYTNVLDEFQKFVINYDYDSLLE